MVYYTFGGSYDDIKYEIEKFKENLYRSNNISERNEVSSDKLTDLIAAVMQYEEVQPSESITDEDKNIAKLYAKRGYYNIKISEIAFRALILLINIIYIGQPIVQIIEIIGFLYDIKNRIIKLDTWSYCVYEKILICRIEISDTLQIDQIENRILTSKCNMDLPKNNKCSHLASDMEQCNLCKEELHKILEKLDGFDLIDYIGNRVKVKKSFDINLRN